MATKIAVLFLVIFFVIQVTLAASIRKIRDTNAQELGSNTGKTIDDAVESLKTSFDDMLKNIQNNDLLKDLTEGIQKFGESVQVQGKELVAKVQSAAKN